MSNNADHRADHFARASSVTFADCLRAAAAEPEFVANFDRLCGANLSLRGSALELMIDEQTGRLENDLAMFVAFVADVVWMRLPPGVRDE